MIVKLQLTKLNALLKLLGFYNYIQPQSSNVLTPSEMELLAVFCTLPDKYKHSMFSIQGKKKATGIYQEIFGKTLSGVNLNNKIYCLLDKGFLHRDEDKVIYIKPFLLDSIKKMNENKTIQLGVTINVENS